MSIYYPVADPRTDSLIHRIHQAWGGHSLLRIVAEESQVPVGAPVLAANRETLLRLRQQGHDPTLLWLGRADAWVRPPGSGLTWTDQPTESAVGVFHTPLYWHDMAPRPPAEFCLGLIPQLLSPEEYEIARTACQELPCPVPCEVGQLEQLAIRPESWLQAVSAVVVGRRNPLGALQLALSAGRPVISFAKHTAVVPGYSGYAVTGRRSFMQALADLTASHPFPAGTAKHCRSFGRLLGFAQYVRPHWEAAIFALCPDSPFF